MLCACSAQTGWSGAVGSADYALFVRDVYPVLMRDCAYANCHGAEQRFFQVWGPGRTRLDTDDKRTPIQDQEKLRSFQRSVSMLYTDGSRPLAESPLLIKPLEASSGGAAHGGVDRYGRNVYRSNQDPAYQILLRWASGATAGPTVVAGAGAAASGSGGALAPAAGASSPTGVPGAGAPAAGSATAGTLAPATSVPATRTAMPVAAAPAAGAIAPVAGALAPAPGSLGAGPGVAGAGGRP